MRRIRSDGILNEIYAENKDFQLRIYRIRFYSVRFDFRNSISRRGLLRLEFSESFAGCQRKPVYVFDYSVLVGFAGIHKKAFISLDFPAFSRNVFIKRRRLLL